MRTLVSLSLPVHPFTCFKLAAIIVLCIHCVTSFSYSGKIISGAKIAICDFDTRDFLTTVTQRNHATYAKHNGYSYYHGRSIDLELVKGRTAHWVRFPIILNLLRTHEWVLWLDSDAMFVNFTKPIESLLIDHKIVASDGGESLRHHGGSKSFLFSGVILFCCCAFVFLILSYHKDYNAVNSGVLLIRRSKFSFHMLDEVWKIGGKMIEWGKQAAIGMGYDNCAFAVFLAGCTSNSSFEEYQKCYDKVDRGWIEGKETFLNISKADPSTYARMLPPHILHHIQPVSQRELNCYDPNASKLITHFAHQGRTAFRSMQEWVDKLGLHPDPDIVKATTPSWGSYLWSLLFTK